MSELLEITVLGTWDGEDTQTKQIADLLLAFPGFEPPEMDILGKPTTTELLLLIELEKEIQKIADARFGQGNVRIEAEIRRGSLEILVILTIVATSVYKFFKDYADLRRGVLAFVVDLRSVASFLDSVVDKHLGQRKKRKSDRRKGERKQERRREK